MARPTLAPVAEGVAAWVDFEARDSANMRFGGQIRDDDRLWHNYGTVEAANMARFIDGVAGAYLAGRPVAAAERGDRFKETMVFADVDGAVALSDEEITALVTRATNLLRDVTPQRSRQQRHFLCVVTRNVVKPESIHLYWPRLRTTKEGMQWIGNRWVEEGVDVDAAVYRSLAMRWPFTAAFSNGGERSVHEVYAQFGGDGKLLARDKWPLRLEYAGQRLTHACVVRLLTVLRLGNSASSEITLRGVALGAIDRAAHGAAAREREVDEVEEDLEAFDPAPPLNMLDHETAFDQNMHSRLRAMIKAEGARATLEYMRARACWMTPNTVLVKSYVDGGLGSRVEIKQYEFSALCTEAKNMLCVVETHVQKGPKRIRKSRPVWQLFAAASPYHVTHSTVIPVGPVNPPVLHDSFLNAFTGWAAYAHLPGLRGGDALYELLPSTIEGPTSLAIVLWFIHTVLCNSRPIATRCLLMVVAHMFFMPHVPLAKVAFLIGPQGCGKTTLLWFLRGFFGGAHSVVTNNLAAFLGEFNAMLENYPLVLVDEAEVPSDTFVKINNLTTAREAIVQRKYHERHVAPTATRILLAANIFMGSLREYQRRMIFITTDPAVHELTQPALIQRFARACEDPALPSAFAELLWAALSKRRDWSELMTRRYYSSTYIAARHRGLPPLESFWYRCLSAGKHPFDKVDPDAFVPSAQDSNWMSSVSITRLMEAFHSTGRHSSLPRPLAVDLLRQWGLTRSGHEGWLDVPDLWHCRARFEEATESPGSLSGRSATEIDNEVYGLATVRHLDDPAWNPLDAYNTVFGDGFIPPPWQPQEVLAESASSQ